MIQVPSRAFRRAAPRQSRPGIAMIWAVVILALLAVLLQLLVGHMLAGRQQLAGRQDRLQADWLARAGIELAAARLLTAPAGYTGESVELIPGAQVRVEVKRDSGQADTYRVVSEVRYPAGNRPGLVRTLARRFRRKVEKDRVHLEVLTPAAARR